MDLAAAAVARPCLDNLIGQARGWEHYPEWMDYLSPQAPNFRAKELERELYLHQWGAWLDGVGAVLDLGGGCGRLSLPLLARGASVELVDPDLRALEAAVRRAASLPGRLDVTWGLAEHVLGEPDRDVVLLAEVLCYTDRPRDVVDVARRRLRPGGVALVSVEASLGWVATADAAPGTLPAVWGDGLVHAPGDRWVQTCTRERLVGWLEGWAILELEPRFWVTSGPFAEAAGELEVEHALQLERRCEADPRLAPWHRAWLAVARPEGP